jgi:hypothetical protein
MERKPASVRRKEWESGEWERNEEEGGMKEEGHKKNNGADDGYGMICMRHRTNVKLLQGATCV